MAGVAQLVRASGCGPEGRGFETHRSPQIHKVTMITLLNILASVLPTPRPL
jgi:hypothetical protein